MLECEVGLDNGVCRVCVEYVRLDERKQKPSFISQPSSVTRTERTVGRQRANNSVDQAPSKAVAKCRAAPYHATLPLTQTLIFIPL